ncbi:MAG: hypothetical protein U1F68_18960 [Gammaproteobacteria bacterium]
MSKEERIAGAMLMFGGLTFAGFAQAECAPENWKDCEASLGRGRQHGNPGWRQVVAECAVGRG